MEASPNGTISLSGDETEELRGYFEKLAEGGQIAVPLEQAPWGDYFGQLTDRYGVSWMVNIAGQRPATRLSLRKGRTRPEPVEGPVLRQAQHAEGQTAAVTG